MADGPSVDGRWLVALDVDGTLVDYDQRLSPRVRDAVAAVRDAGHHVVVSTGRSIMGTTRVLADLGLTHGAAVLSNGAVTVLLDPVAGARLDAAPHRHLRRPPGRRAAPARAARRAVRGGGHRRRHPGERAVAGGRAVRRAVHRPVRGAASTARPPAWSCAARSTPPSTSWSWSSGSACTASPTPSATRPGSTSRRRACPRRARWSRCGRSWAWTPRAPWRSGTAATTWRCWPGPRAGWRWATPRRWSATPPTRWRPDVEDDGLAEVLEGLLAP